MRLTRHLGLLLTVVALLVGCDSVVRRTAPAPEDAFARAYIAALRDSGAAAVLPQTTPATRNEPGFGTMIDTLRTVIAASQDDSLTLSKWEVVRENGRLPVTHLVYKGTGARGPFEVGIWVERDAESLWAETIHFGPPSR